MSHSNKVITPEIIENSDKILLEDRRFKLFEIVENVKNITKYIPDEEDLSKISAANANVSAKVEISITMDETWIQPYINENTLKRIKPSMINNEMYAYFDRRN